MLNISQIHIPTIAVPQANQIPSETWNLLKHYEREGFVEMGPEAPFQNQSAIYWGTVNYIKPLVLTHCYLKNALKYEYILLLEVDEALVYNFSKYRNLAEMFATVSSLNNVLSNSKYVGKCHFYSEVLLTFQLPNSFLTRRFFGRGNIRSLQSFLFFYFLRPGKSVKSEISKLQ